MVYGEIINIGGKMEDIESIWDYGNTFICWAPGGRFVMLLGISEKGNFVVVMQNANNYNNQAFFLWKDL